MIKGLYEKACPKCRSYKNPSYIPVSFNSGYMICPVCGYETKVYEDTMNRKWQEWAKIAWNRKSKKAQESVSE